MSNFIDTLGPYMADEDLWLQEFSKSLCDQAYIWYPVLKPGSISTWDNMVDVFCTRYFHGEKTVMLATLQGTNQRSSDDLMEYIKRFKDIALDYYDHCEEKTLMEKRHQFSKSLCDRAYTWYTVLKPGSISTWDNMVDVFCTRYFHGEKTVTLATLQGTKQRSSDDLMEYIKRFKDIALDYYDHCEEKTLVEMCMSNTIMEYRAVLENLEIP